MSKKKSTKRDAARRKRNARGWSTRSNRTPSTLNQGGGEGEPVRATSSDVPALPPIDAPAPRSLLERVPPVARWLGLVSVSLVIGSLVAVNHTVQLGLTAGLATLLAGGAFLAAFLPPSLRKRPGDGAAVGFGRATGHKRPAADDADEDQAPPNRAARRRARKDQK
jgi:hypothetical protein